MRRTLLVAAATLFVLAAACSSKGDPAPQDDPETARAGRATSSAGASADDSAVERRGKVGIDITLPQPVRALATRCAVPGPALIGTCRAEIRSIAATLDGDLYLIDEGNNLRSYHLAQGDGCVLTLDTSFGTGGIIAPPPDRQILQSFESPVYMRSGGPDLRVAFGPDSTAYVYDFLLGIYKVTGATLAPVCTDLSGIGWFGATGKKSLTMLRGGELFDVKVGRKQCSIAPITVDAPVGMRAPAAFANGALYVAGSHAENGANVVVRLFEASATAIYGAADSFDPGGLCSINAMAECGDQLCVADGNCQELDAYTRDGVPVSATKLSDVVGERYYAIRDLQAAPDGGLWIAVTLKTDEWSADDPRCEGALFRLR